MDALASISRVGITSVGKNYLSSPGLVVLDGLTKKVVPDISLDYEIGDTELTILRNSKNLNNVTPIIIPTSNSNGITINNIDYNEGTQDVTVTIGASFSDAADYPFEVGKKVMIEGVSVGVGSTGKGYNSENFEYTLFEILATHPNIGGTLGTVRYNLSDVIPTGSIPGNFISATSSGKIIAESQFPIFDIELEDNKFEIGETLISGNKKGILQSTNKLTGILKVSSPHTFLKGESISGESSETKATIVDVVSYNSLYEVESSSIVNEGWKNNSGFLNDNQQRIFDSEYYQYFSYSLQSAVQFTKWKEAVSSLNHTAGFKKFSDLIVKSESDVGVSTDQSETKFEVVTDLISVMDLNTVFDFDLVREKTLTIGSRTISDEVVFDTRILADYSESIGNRVLTIDDISTEFNNNARTCLLYTSPSPRD